MDEFKTHYLRKLVHAFVATRKPSRGNSNHFNDRSVLKISKTTGGLLITSVLRLSPLVVRPSSEFA